MKKQVLSILGAGLLAFSITGVSEATVIYQEDFSQAPNFTLSPDFGTKAGSRGLDTATWNSTAGTYEVVTYEYGPGAYKFAQTESFGTIDGSNSFTVQLDFRSVIDSIGMSQFIMFANGSIPAFPSTEPWSEMFGPQIQLEEQYFRGNVRFREPTVGVFGSVTAESPRINQSLWYTLSLSYDSNYGTADFLITNRDSQSLFFEANDLAFNPGSFDRLAFGAYTRYWDGYRDIMYIDNIVVDVDGAPTPTPEPATMLLFGTGLAGLAGTRLRRKNKA